MTGTISGQDPIIVPAELEDLEFILALQKIAYLSEAALINDYSIPPLKQTLTQIRDEFSHTLFLKVGIHDRIIGSVRAEEYEKTCYIKKLIVHPDFQNLGIGSMLMSRIEQNFSRVNRFELFTGSESKKNCAFYSRRGYRPFKEESVTEKLTLVYFEKQNDIR